jgi:DNA-directed RNA polymerase subunit RPC12/RpoP
MTRDELQNRTTANIITAVIIPLIGFLLLFKSPFLALFFILGGPILGLILYASDRAKTSSINWAHYICPWCGQAFEAEPQDTFVRHIRCRQQIVLKNGQAYKLGETPANITS